MAASGYTPISLYYSTTASAVPTAGNLANGELALNIADMKLYAKNSAGTVTLLASNASTTGVDSLSFGSTGLTPSTATTGAITVAGTLATTNGGTGLTSFTANGVLYASSTSALTSGSALTFDGANLGVGTTTPNSIGGNSNAKYLGVVGDGTLSSADGRIVLSNPQAYGSIVSNTTTAGRVYFQLLNGSGGSITDGAYIAGLSSGSGGASGYGIDLGFYTKADNSASSIRMRLDSAGNLGLGVTPSAWSGATALQVGSYAFVYTNNTAGSAEVSSNAYKSGSSTWTYLNSNSATRYRQQDGAHSWLTAASGTAGNTISFTQAMTLDASGNLGVGTTSPSSRVHVVGINTANRGQLCVQSDSAGNEARITLYDGTDNIGEFGTSGTSVYAYSGGNLLLYAGAAERARIDSSGNLLVGTTATAAAKLTVASTTNPALTLPNIAEIATVSATAATGTINYDLTTQSVLYYTTNASGNFTMNIRGNSGLSLNSMMSTGQSVTMAFLCTNGGTAYYQTAMTIDGTSVTPKWQGGTAPSSGNASSVDIYSYTIIKTGSATYTVFASQTKFA